MAILFSQVAVKVAIRNRRLLKKFITEFIQANSQFQQMELHYVFCNDDYLLQINQQFLQHDTFTDIITFDLSENATYLQAEIYISTTRVQENAILFEMPFETELRRVIFHGMLHLCGFNDKTKEQKKVMHSMEDQCLQSFERLLLQK